MFTSQFVSTRPNFRDTSHQFNQLQWRTHSRSRAQPAARSGLLCARRPLVMLICCPRNNVKVNQQQQKATAPLQHDAAVTSQQDNYYDCWWRNSDCCCLKKFLYLRVLKLSQECFYKGRQGVGRLSNTEIKAEIFFLSLCDSTDWWQHGLMTARLFWWGSCSRFDCMLRQRRKTLKNNL